MEKNMFKKLGLGAGLIAGCLTSLKAETVKNIFTVDMAKVYDNFYKTKPAQENFQLLAKQAQEEVERMMQEGKKLFDQRQDLINKVTSPACTEATKKDLEKQIVALDETINKKGEEINNFRQEKDVKLDQQRQAILSEHFKEINAGIESLAKTKNADFILNKAGGSVLYSKPEYDLTDEVITIVNKPAKANEKSLDKNIEKRLDKNEKVK